MADRLPPFPSLIDFRSPDECWPWLGHLTPDGYGVYGWYRAHRVSWETFKGQSAWRYIIRHSCDNPKCVNPAHLFIGTHADNVADRVLRDRSAKGEGNGRSKLTEAQVLAILSSPLDRFYLAGIYNISPDTVRKIRSGKLWKHLQHPPF